MTMQTSNDRAKVAYIICATLMQIFLITMAVVAPVVITPGQYYWTGAMMALVVLSSYGFGARLNSWGDFGRV